MLFIHYSGANVPGIVAFRLLGTKEVAGASADA